MKLVLAIFLQIILLNNCAGSRYKKKLPIVEDRVSSKYDNPNFVRDRSKFDIAKPEMPELFKERHRKPYNPAWMDYCDPYHCNDYHRTACGLNRKTMRFKWFQSVCHIILNNKCAAFRGALKFDIVDTKFCVLYVMYLRIGCPSTCDDDDDDTPVCGMSSSNSDSILFRSKCALEMTNCREAQGFSGKPEFSNSLKTSKYTLPIQERVAILKEKIADQIKSKNIVFEESEVTAVDENVEYEDNENEPLTPINEKDPRKKLELYKLKQIKTSTTRGLSKNIDNDFDIPERNFGKRGKAFERKASKKVVSEIRPIRKKKKFTKPKISDVFYRRALKDIGAQQWTHCQALITPYMTGHKVNISVTKRISYDDVVVIRLVQLLTEDITGHSKDDIHSILYQISNLQLRLFQWDVAAIKLLLNVINSNKAKRHTFKTIKYGLKAIFKTWKLNFGSNISLLMKQTRLFRPPCVQITHMGGSTRTSKTIRYSKASTKKRCFKNDDNYEKCMRNE